jgi:predicted P-loop ATPase
MSQRKLQQPKTVTLHFLDEVPINDNVPIGRAERDAYSHLAEGFDYSALLLPDGASVRFPEGGFRTQPRVIATDGYDELAAANDGLADDPKRNQPTRQAKRTKSRAPEKPRNANEEHHPVTISDWMLDNSNKPVSNLANAALAFRRNKGLVGIVGYDEMSREAMLMRPIPGSRAKRFSKPRRIDDADVASLQEYLQLLGLATVGKDTTHQAVDIIARENSFHPIRDYLEGLIWDGKGRLGNWLHTYARAEATEYHSAIGRMFLISMVARVMKPGCKCDYMLILEGTQGDNKSTALSILAGEWFSDGLPDLNGDPVRLSMHLNGKWLIEIAEMHRFSSADVSALKAFITKRDEQYVRKHGRKESHEPRQCVFGGTTNESTYLRDETGARRFWPVPVGILDLVGLERDRDQLFSEAMHAYMSGEPWHPSREFEAEHIVKEQEARFVVDAWEDDIRPYLDKQPAGKPLLVREVAEDAVGVHKDKLDKTTQTRIKAIMRRCGWVQLQSRRGGGFPWGRKAAKAAAPVDVVDGVEFRDTGKLPAAAYVADYGDDDTPF